MELEQVYPGNYLLKPRAEIMYFPAFYGRNNIKNLTIKSRPEEVVN